MIETTGQSIHGFWKDCEFSGAAAVEMCIRDRLVPYDILSSQQFQDDYKFSVQFVDDIENGLQATMEHISKLLTNVGLFVLFLTSMTFVDRWIPLYVIALTVMAVSYTHLDVYKRQV